MRSTLVAVVVLSVLLSACSRPASGPSGAAASGPSADLGRPLPSPLPDVVARVNGQPIDIRQILPLAKVELDRVSVPDRDRLKAGIVRRALQKYVDRELLLQEALARGVHVDSRQVDWAYDQMRREHADDGEWAEFLAGQGMDPASLRTELRAQHTLASLLRLEQTGGAAGQPLEEVQAGLVARLRAKARIEILL